MRENDAANRPTVGLVDYKVGNRASLQGALERVGFRVVSGDEPGAFAGVDCLVLPGVGSMPYAMAALRGSGLDAFIAERFADRRTPIIGVCLGMQILFEHSEEGDCEALGLIPGRVRRLPEGMCHVGWNLTRTPPEARRERREVACYFNHSYYVDCDPAYVVSTSRLDTGFETPAIVRAGPFTGLQFHPEKSQAAGRDMLAGLIERGVHA